MKPATFLACVFVLAVQSACFGADPAVKVTDQEGSTVDVAPVDTKIVTVTEEGTKWEYKVPLDILVSISQSKDGKSFVLTNLRGSELVGSFSYGENLEGKTALGAYKLQFSEIKAIDFGRKPDTKLAEHIVSKQPEGFSGTCHSREGAKRNVWKLAFNFWYSYPTPGWIGKSSTSEDNQRYFVPAEYHDCVVGLPFSSLKSVTFAKGKDADSLLPSITASTQKGEELSLRAGEYGEGHQGFVGWTEFGNVYIPLQASSELSRIELRQPEGKAPGCNVDSAELPKEYVATIKTWDGHSVSFSCACLLLLDDGYRWAKGGSGRDRFNAGVSTEVDLKTGAAENRVDFSKIRKIVVTERGKPQAKLTTTSGATLDVAWADTYWTWFGGMIESFGVARVPVSKIASIEITKAPMSPPTTKPVEQK